MTTLSAAPGRNAAKRPLPDGWRYAKLGEVLANIQPGFACGQRDDAGVVQVRMNNVLTDGNFKWDELVRVPSGHTDMTRYWLEPGDVLFNNTNSVELVGKSAKNRGFTEAVVYSNHFSRLRPVQEVLSSEFLVHWMVHQWCEGFFAGICDRWVGQAAVSRTKLVGLEIPLPPLSEQHRIANTLNQQMAMAEQARNAAVVMLETVDALKNAFLREIFALGKNLARGWRWVALGEVCYKPEYGASAPAQPYNPSLPRYVRITDITDSGDLKPDNPRSADPNLTDGYELSDGDLLFARSGSVGRTYLYREQDGLAVFAGYLIRFRAKTDVVLPEYIALYTQSSPYWQWVSTTQRQGTQPNINATEYASLPIPLPPLPEQRRIAALLKRRMALAEELRAAAQVKLAALDALPAALLRLAFAGEL